MLFATLIIKKALHKYQARSKEAVYHRYPLSNPKNNHSSRKRLVKIREKMKRDRRENYLKNQ
jgi:hypothetical protein